MVITSIYKLTIPVPDGVKVDLQGNLIKIKGPKGELKRNFFATRIKISMNGNNVEVSCDLPRKKEKALVGTWAGHISNMITGVTKGFEYRMKVVYAHFPIKVQVKEGKVFIENFLGERTPRKAVILGDTKVQIQGDIVTLSGTDIEAVSQTAANIEMATKIKDYDSRIFQDGIYITHKGV
ncbi:MAG: 50S ribosomal protein L6 [Thermoplasmata archaeon]